MRGIIDLGSVSFTRFIVCLPLVLLPLLGVASGKAEKTGEKDKKKAQGSASITGRVLSAAGTPIRGAKVQAFEDESSEKKASALPGMISIDMTQLEGREYPEAVTSSNGTFDLRGLARKLYRVRAIAPGHACRDVVEISAPRGQLELVLEPALNVSGSVHNSAGSAIKDARVKAYFENESKAPRTTFGELIVFILPQIASVRTGQDGVFKFDTLGPGEYTFVVEAKAYQTAEENRKIVAGATKQSLDFSLTPGHILSGMVRGRGQRAVPDCQVRVRRTDAPDTASAARQVPADEARGLTDKQGKFLFDTLAEGKYELTCSHPDYLNLRRLNLRAPAEGITLDVEPKKTSK